MTVEIHAAIVGGVLAGAVVLVGVVLAEWLQRRRHERQKLEGTVLELVIALPYALYAASVSRPGTQGTDLGSVVFAQGERTIQLLGTVRALRGRRFAAIRSEAEDVAARLTGAHLRQTSGNPLTWAEMVEITANRLWSLTFKTPSVDARANWYGTHGFQSGRPPKDIGGK